jgi:4-hydroxy-3-methylbut-2-enyl diphosphate reductase
MVAIFAGMKQFDVPVFYRSPLISAIKAKRKTEDKLKKDFSPTLLEMGRLRIYLARHFGFCYGVENAIEIAYRCVDENPGKRIFLLSEMIHNPQVNADLEARGVRFLHDQYGKVLIPLDEVTPEDVVVIPAFGATLDMEKQLEERGISPFTYNTTCPFVEKVWNRGEQLADKGYSLVIHGKPLHEETRATFSRAARYAPSVVVNNLDEARELAKYLMGEKEAENFYQEFDGRYSPGFRVPDHLQYIGVINQTTQLATDTQQIADFLKKVLESHLGESDSIGKKRFADTRDTLCYATNDNQQAVRELLNTPADLALVVGGYNSSNTSHLVELCEEVLPSYFIKEASALTDASQIVHYNWRGRQELITQNWLPEKETITVLLTSGASCPDALVEQVIERLLSLTDSDPSLIENAQQFFAA